MALVAEFQERFSKVDAYHVIRSIAPDRMTGEVTVKLAIFKDEPARKAYKAASAALAVSADKIRELMADDTTKKVAFNALAEKTPAAQRALEADMEEIAAKVRAEKRKQQVEFGNIQTNRFEEAEVKIPTGGVTIGEDGTVPAKAVYDWLKANPLKGAKDI